MRRSRGFAPDPIDLGMPVQEILSTGEQSPLRPVINATALGRPGEAEDIVYAALYLASDEARWVTGTHLVVDGGSSVLI